MHPLNRFAALALSALMIAGAAVPAQAAKITVFAAASLRTAMDRIAADWKADTGNTAVVSYAGSSNLARQIEEGAPADVFISANEGWMNRLQQKGLIDAKSRRDLLGNQLVLVASNGTAKVTIGKGFDLAKLLGPDHLAMAMVDSVPAGIYGKAALTSLGVWASVKGQVAQADNVRAALALVATGEAPYGITYATDAVAEPRVAVVGTFPADSHPPIIYPAAVVNGARAGAGDFLRYLSGTKAAAAFTAQGLKVVTK